MTRNVVTHAPGRLAGLRRGVLALMLVMISAAGLNVIVSPMADAATNRRPDIANAVLRLLNAERRAHHLPTLRMNPALVTAANAHNNAMRAGNTLTHQASGELSLGQRLSAAGYHWSSAAENVGVSTTTSRKGGLALETSMFNESAPSKEHRLNILSTSYRHVGIDVVIDAATGKLWLTEDFG